jgi:hypothetical protein
MPMKAGEEVHISLTSVPSEAPRSAVSPASTRVPRMLSALVVVGSLMIVVALGASVIWGWQAGSAIFAFATAVGGLARFLIEIQLKWEDIPQHDHAAKRRLLSRRPLAPVITTAVVAGVFIGTFVVPLLVGFGLQPTAALEIPDQVRARQELRVSWRNLTALDDVRVLVRPLGQSTEFILACRAPGSRRGATTCTADIGGADDEGKPFEIRVIRLPRPVSEALIKEAVEQDYIERLPEGAELLTSKAVTRLGSN